MKNKGFFYNVLLITFTAFAFTGCGGSDSSSPNPETTVNEQGTTSVNLNTMQDSITDLPKKYLSDNEKEDLIFTREEEKLAYDVYKTLYDSTGLPIFTNIAEAEATHTDSVKLLLDKYELADPVATPQVIGEFENETLQKLYYDLVNEGSDQISALQVGAKIEELDIDDLQQAQDRADNEDIRLVYENLLKGSRNHLRAFYQTLQNQGGDYQPEYISQGDFDQIVNSDFERQ